MGQERLRCDGFDWLARKGSTRLFSCEIWLFMNQEKMKKRKCILANREIKIENSIGMSILLLDPLGPMNSPASVRLSVCPPVCLNILISHEPLGYTS